MRINFKIKTVRHGGGGMIRAGTSVSDPDRVHTPMFQTQMAGLPAGHVSSAIISHFRAVQLVRQFATSLFTSRITFDQPNTQLLGSIESVSVSAIFPISLQVAI